MRTARTNKDELSVIEPEATIGADDPGEDDLAVLIRRARVTGPLTRTLLILVLVGAGFLSGALGQKHFGSSGTASTSGAVPAELQALLANGRTPNSGNQSAAGGGAGGGTFGTVKLIDGNAVYVADAQGNVTKILTNDSTKVTINKDGTIADLTPAKSVLVQGTTNADGTVTATQITETSGATGFPGGGAPATGAAGN